MLDIFPHNTISVTYKRNKNLREILSPSLFPRTTKKNECYIKEYNKKYGISKNFIVVSPDFTCFATNRKHKIERISVTIEILVTGYPANVVVSNMLGPATCFKERFRIRKSQIKTGKIRCGLANHLLNFCCSSTSKFENLQLQLIVKVSVQNDDNIDKVLWERERYWQAQLFTLSHGLNNPNEWYALSRRRVYRK